MPQYRGYSFGLQPASKLAKTIMSQPNTHSTTMDFGRVVPIKCAHIVPGDIISEKVAALIRMSTPKAPIFTGIKASLHAFFVPMRLLWEHTKEFYGENTSSAGPQLVEYFIPHTIINGTSDDTTVKVGSVAHYLGYPLRKRPTSGTGAARNDRTLNVLPLRGYWEIINNYYRAEQVMDPWLVDYGDTGAIGTRGGVALKVSDVCAKSLKNFDIFTTSLIAPTYGGETSLPLLGYAPLGVANSSYNLDTLAGGAGAIRFGPNSLSGQDGVSLVNIPGEGSLLYGHPLSGSDVETATQYKAGNNTFSTNIVADLSKATATKLNDLYLAMAVEKWKYHANFGSRYFARLEVSYGVRNPDLVLDRPEHLGEYHFDINVQTVISTATTNDAILGQPGANSATAINCNLFNHSFGEYGYLYILMNTYIDQVYSAGADRFLTDRDILDLYWPEFVNKGDEKVLTDNIYFDEGVAAATAGTFGYQEAWAFERFTKSRTSGLLDSYVDTNLNSDQAGIKGFVLAQKFSTAPSLDETFLTEDRTPFTEALVTGENGPDFVCDFFFDEKVTRSITPRSEPGIPSRLW